MIVSGRAKGAKLLLENWDAIADGNPKRVSSSLRKYVSFHRSHILSKTHGISPERAISAEATILAGIARKRGLDMQLSTRETDLYIALKM